MANDEGSFYIDSLTPFCVLFLAFLGHNQFLSLIKIIVDVKQEIILLDIFNTEEGLYIFA